MGREIPSPRLDAPPAPGSKGGLPPAPTDLTRRGEDRAGMLPLNGISAFTALLSGAPISPTDSARDGVIRGATFPGGEQPLALGTPYRKGQEQVTLVALAADPPSDASQGDPDQSGRGDAPQGAHPGDPHPGGMGSGHGGGNIENTGLADPGDEDRRDISGADGLEEDDAEARYKREIPLPGYVKLMSVSSPIRGIDDGVSGAEGRVSVRVGNDGKGTTTLVVGDTRHITFRLTPEKMDPKERFLAATFNRTICDGVVLVSKEPHGAETISIIHTYPKQRPFVEEQEPSLTPEIEPSLAAELKQLPLANELVHHEAQYHYPSGRRGFLIISEPSQEEDPVKYALSLIPLTDEIATFTGEDNPPILIVTMPGREIQRRIDEDKAKLDADIHFTATKKQSFITVPLTGDKINL